MPGRPPSVIPAADRSGKHGCSSPGTQRPSVRIRHRTVIAPAGRTPVGAGVPSVAPGADAARPRAGHAIRMASPSTEMSAAGSGCWAGPFVTLPSVMLNLLPWQAQLMVPSDTSATRQFWWVQTAE